MSGLTSSPFSHNSMRVPVFMGWVAIALLPALFCYTWFFGWGVLVHMGIGIVTALVSEVVMLRLRQRPVKPFITDNSAIITAMLIAFCVPPLAPWWIMFVGVAFAMVFGKHLYGGLGNNLFNPAMLGFAMLLISFPAEMTAWTAPTLLTSQLPNLSETISIIMSGSLRDMAGFDAISMATPLDTLKTQLGMLHTTTDIMRAPVFGTISGKGWEWINIAFLFGGLLLIWKKIIRWHIPVAMLGSLFVMATIFYLVNPDTHASPVFHIFSGAAMIGAFFIATDPVTAATSNKGKIIFGAGIGVFIYIIRTWGGFPDAIAFSVLIMNMTVPIIDYYTRPRVFGHGGDNTP